MRNLKKDVYTADEYTVLKATKNKQHDNIIYKYISIVIKLEKYKTGTTDNPTKKVSKLKNNGSKKDLTTLLARKKYPIKTTITKDDINKNKLLVNIMKKSKLAIANIFM